MHLDSGCPPNASLRLIGSDYYMGRAEVCAGTTWACICGNNFTRQHGELICLQLGFSGLYRYSAGPAQCTSGVWRHIECDPDAQSFEECTVVLITADSCPLVNIECYSKLAQRHKYHSNYIGL